MIYIFDGSYYNYNKIITVKVKTNRHLCNKWHIYNIMQRVFDFGHTCGLDSSVI
jgi:hypothetical protein